MDIQDLHNFINRIPTSKPTSSKLCIQVSSPGHVGGTPTVSVDHMINGFDWDTGKIIIVPSKPLSVLSEADVKAIHESLKLGQSWYSSNERQSLKERILRLEQENAILKQKGN